MRSVSSHCKFTRFLTLHFSCFTRTTEKFKRPSYRLQHGSHSRKRRKEDNSPFPSLRLRPIPFQPAAAPPNLVATALRRRHRSRPGHSRAPPPTPAPARAADCVIRPWGGFLRAERARRESRSARCPACLYLNLYLSKWIMTWRNYACIAERVMYCVRLWFGLCGQAMKKTIWRFVNSRRLEIYVVLCFVGSGRLESFKFVFACYWNHPLHSFLLKHYLVLINSTFKVEIYIPAAFLTQLWLCRGSCSSSEMECVLFF